MFEQKNTLTTVIKNLFLISILLAKCSCIIYVYELFNNLHFKLELAKHFSLKFIDC